MSGTQRLVVTALALVTVTTLGLMAASAIQSLNQLTPLSSPTLVSQLSRELPSTWTPTPDSSLRPTSTPQPTSAG